ncbi:MAG: hypothetical protein RL328_514 [Acidobacteriota bacterium]|jgi:predicted nucleic acid-binding protein
MILIDTGPLVALVNRTDQHHKSCVAAVLKVRGHLCTVWPVLTEVMYFLKGLPSSQTAIWEMIQRGTVRLLPLGLDDVPRIQELMQVYSDLPMDLADAALVRVAEREGRREFFTVDRRDFSVYRLHGRLKPKIVP